MNEATVLVSSKSFMFSILKIGVVYTKTTSNSDIDNRIRQVGGYLADILDKAESDFVKSVLNVINPKVNKNHHHNCHCHHNFIFSTNSTVFINFLSLLDPKDGTDYWLGGLDADRDKGLQWISGAEMVCPLLELAHLVIRCCCHCYCFSV